MNNEGYLIRHPDGTVVASCGVSAPLPVLLAQLLTVCGGLLYVDCEVFGAEGAAVVAGDAGIGVR